MYALLHPPNFAAQVVAHERPELRKRAFALTDGEPPGEVVVAVNIRTETDIGSPLLKIAEIAEKLKRLVFVEQLEANRIAHVRFEDRGGLFKIV
jgi:hypothetical protein